MKYTLCIIFLVLLISACSDKIELDDSQAKTFNKLYGNSGDDRGVEIKELEDGTFLIFGTIETANKSTELALIKIDRFGNEQWTETYGRNNEDVAGGLSINKNGKILICGTSSKVSDFATEENSTDIIVYEVDGSGRVIESYLFDYGDNEVGNDIAFDGSGLGGFMLVGSSDAFRQTAEGDFTPNPKFRRDMLAIRYFANGTDTNDYKIGYDLDDELNSVTYNELTQEFYAAGIVNLQGEQQVQFLALDDSLNTAQKINGIDDARLSGPASVNEIQIINNNEYAIIGTSGNANSNIFVLISFESKITKPGEIITTPDIIISKSGSLKGYSFTYDNGNSNFIISGSSNTESNGGYDHYIASVNTENKINWENTFGGTGEEEALAIAPTKDGGYIITGYTGFEGNSLINTIKVDNKGILNP